MNQDKTEATRWSLARRVGFRLLFTYLVLFGVPTFLDDLDELPVTATLTEAYKALQKAVLPWVGKHVLRLREAFPMEQTGSGDRTADYVQLLTFLALAAVTALIWSALDRRSRSHERLERGLRVGVRYLLATTMFVYGMAKIWKTQFPFPGTDQLLQPYGDSSPMRLLWNFMGFSTGYNIFTGGAELVGALLLFFRRTTTLGALVVAGVMANVTMLNFCYDVPVKLYSLHWLLLAVLLLIPDLRRLANLLVLNRPTEAVTLRTPLSSRWLERARLPLKALYIGTLFFLGIRAELSLRALMNGASPKLPCVGLFQVESFVRNGVEVPPMLTEAARWRTVSINNFGRFLVRQMDDSQKRYWVKDPAKDQVFTFQAPTGEQTTMTYAMPDPEHVVLTGTHMNEALTIRLRKMDVSQFLLVNRGFHWISEFPYNR